MTLMELLPLRPDLIIVFDGYNDISRVEEGEAPGTPEYTPCNGSVISGGPGYLSVAAGRRRATFIPGAAS